MTEEQLRKIWTQKNNDSRINFCYEYMEELIDNNLLEEFFRTAMTMAHFLTSHAETIESIVPNLNRDALWDYMDREHGCVLPDEQEFTLYRGIVIPKQKMGFIEENVQYNLWRSCGFSWTDSLETAAWFTFYTSRGVPEEEFDKKYRRIILRAIFPRDLILFYSNERGENEYFVCEDEWNLDLEASGLEMLPLTAKEIKQLYDKHIEDRKEN